MYIKSASKQLNGTHSCSFANYYIDFLHHLGDSFLFNLLEKLSNDQ